jgi:hypothetical protein
MSSHTTISPGEAADRLAIGELVETYAHCADRRDAKRRMSLFTADTHVVVFMNAKDRDAFVKQNGNWLFAERRLYVGWTEVRAIS